jgi:RNA polymerase sigma factor (sigma-70 family)
VFNVPDAEDVTQEILIKVVTKLSTFEGRSAFRTWLYRIVVNHVLSMNRRRMEAVELTFEQYGLGLSSAPDLELPDPRAVPADVKLLVDEARISCSSGMLLCLTREQRLVYVLGDIFGVTDAVGAELLEVSKANFRQKLSRARRDLHAFMHNQCGLVNAANPCRCAKKTQAFISAGYVDPERLVFAHPHLVSVRDVAPRMHEGLNELDDAYAEIHRSHPFQESPDFVAALRDLMNQPRFRSVVEES